MKLSLFFTAACLGVSVTYGDMAEKIRKPLSKLFTGLDKDAGGSLTVDEFSRLQGGKKYGKILSEKTLVAFAIADADHDQSISEEEFHAYQTNPHLEIYADKIAAFVRADRNHDAALNAKELAFTAKPKLKKSAAAALLAAKDQNADGLLSFTELHGELPKDKSIIGAKVKDLQAILGTAYDAYAKDFLIINNGVVVDVLNTVNTSESGASVGIVEHFVTSDPAKAYLLLLNLPTREIHIPEEYLLLMKQQTEINETLRILLSEERLLEGVSLHFDAAAGAMIVTTLSGYTFSLARVYWSIANNILHPKPIGESPKTEE